MDSIFQIHKEIPSPPGDTIKETIDFIGMSKAELARRMRIASARLKELLAGKTPLHLEIAKQLEDILDISADFWMEREKLYRAEMNVIKRPGNEK